MNRTVIAALGVGFIAACAANPAAEAATINFGAASFDGAVTYTGASLDASSAFDLDGATLLVSEVNNPTDDSGLAVFDVVTLSAATSPVSSNIIYGSGTGPGPLGAVVTLSWTATTGAHTGDKFTETLTTVMSISRTLADQIGLILTGTVTDTGGLFSGAPVLLSLTANQSLGTGKISSSFTNSTTGSTPAIPEPSTWVMMALGFGALGYAAFRQRKANGAVLSV
jgi:PEP-CTERM motif